MGPAAGGVVILLQKLSRDLHVALLSIRCSDYAPYRQLQCLRSDVM